MLGRGQGRARPQKRACLRGVVSMVTGGAEEQMAEEHSSPNGILPDAVRVQRRGCLHPVVGRHFHAAGGRRHRDDGGRMGTSRRELLCGVRA